MTEIAAEALEARRFAGMPGLTGLRRRYARFIAIVDDDASMRVGLTRLLRVHGIKSRSYSSARAFLTALPSAMPDCLIVDVNMPEMTGLDLQRELLKLGVHVPTVVITAIEDESVAADAKSLDAEAFLTKPMNNKSLMAAINSAVEKRN
jgi:FixJ family two-component response regulator